MKPGSSKARLWLAGGLFLLLGLYVLYPQLAVAIQSLRPTDPEAGAFSVYGFVLSDRYYLTGIVNSLWVSLVSVVLAAWIGVPAALLVDRYKFPGRGLVLAGAILPLALPPLVGVIAFWDLLAEPGLLPQWMSLITGKSPRFFALSGIPGMLLVHAYSFSVYFFALTRAGLSNLDPTLEFAAGSLGAPLAVRIRRVILPALWPYLIAAALLTFMTSMSSYSAPAILGDNTRYMTVAIKSDVVSHAERAAVVAVLLTLCNVIFLLVLQLGFGGAWRALGGGSKGTSAPPLREKLPTVRGEMTMALVALVFFALMISPFLVIGLHAVADGAAWNATQTPLTSADGDPGGTRYAALPPAYTGENFAWVFSNSGCFDAILISVFATIAAVVGNLAVAVTAAWLQVRGSRVLRFFVDFLCMLPIALPGTVIAYNLLCAFGAGSPLTLGQALSSTLAILILAYFVRQIPLAVRPVVAAMARVDPMYERAAQSLGATPGTIFLRVILPQLWPGIAAAALLCGVAGLGEYVASVMLTGPSTKPISILIEEENRSFENMGHAAALSLVLVAMTVVVMVAYAYLTRRRRPA